MAGVIPTASPTFSPTTGPSSSPTGLLSSTGEEISSQDLWLSFVSYGGVGLVLLAIFMLLRRKKFYFSRVFYPDYPHEEYISDYDRNYRKGKIVPPSRRSWFGWFWFLLSNRRDSDVLRNAGLDAYVSLRLAKMGIIIFGLWTPFGMFFIAPAYGAQRYNPTILESISLSNVVGQDESVLNWAYVCLLTICALVILMVNREYVHFIQVRKQYLATKAKESFTVVVERIPKQLLSKKQLTNYFNTVVGDVRGVDLVPSQKIILPIQALINQRKNVLIALEKTRIYNSDDVTPRKLFTFDTESNLEELRAFHFDPQTLEDDEKADNGSPLSADGKAMPPVTGSLETGRKLTDLEGQVAEPDANEDDELPEITKKGEKILVSEKFKRIVELSKKELANNMTTKKKLLSLVTSLSCGLLKKHFIGTGEARMVDADEYYSDKLESINLLITWLQYRAEILTDSNYKNEGKIGEATYLDMLKPIANEYSALLESQFEKAAPDDEKDLKVHQTSEDKIALLESTNKQKKSLGGSLRALYHKHKQKKSAETAEQDLARKEMLENVQNSAFITFDSKYAANVVSTMEVNEIQDQLLTSRAKKPDDMLLYNLGYSVLYKTMIGFVTTFLMFMFLLLFGSIVASIGVATNLDNLRGASKAFSDFLDRNDFMIVLFQQLGPVLLVVFFSLIPPIMLAIVNLPKPVSTTEKHSSFLIAYYAFSVIQLFIFYQISGSLTTVLGQTLDDPLDFVNILAVTIPNNAIFFMQFIMIKALFGLPSELLRLSGLITGVVLRCLLTCKYYSNETDRERYSTKCGIAASIQNPVYPFLASTNAQAMLIFTIGICYSVIAPLIAPIVCGYAIIFLLVMRNQFMFVYGTQLKKMDSLGSQFKFIMTSFLIALFLMVGTMIGMFALFERPGLVTLSFPILILIVLTKWYFDRAFSNELKNMPLSLTKLYDSKMKQDRESARPLVEEDKDEEKDAFLKKEPIYDIRDEVEDYRHASLKAPSQETL